MAKFIVQELQTDAQGNTVLLPAELKETFDEAASVFYYKCGFAVVSTVPIHTVITYTDEGFAIPELKKCFKHPVEETPVESE